MSDIDDIELGRPGAAFWCYAFGIMSASVCSSLPAEEVAAELNRRAAAWSMREDFPGMLTWKLSSDTTFKGGEPNPCPCPDSLDHKHYLLES